jgi:proteasome lid subunit RPN8/RPN11
MPREDVGEGSKVRIYLSQEVVGAIEAHAVEQARRRREDLGLLVGDWALDSDGDVYSVAMDLRTGPLVSSPSSVRFSSEGLSQVAKELDATTYPYVIVGWYHTHLGLGVFMSDRDLRTQRGGFPHPHQVAVVVDPLEGEAAAFANGPEGPGTIRVAMASFGKWDIPPSDGLSLTEGKDL